MSDDEQNVAVDVEDSDVNVDVPEDADEESRLPQGEEELDPGEVIDFDRLCWDFLI